MKKQIVSEGTKRLQKDEENRKIFCLVILFLQLCGIDEADIKGLEPESLQLIEKFKAKHPQKEQIKSFLTSSHPNRYIWHATIVYLLMKGTKMNVLCPACGFNRSTIFGWQKKVTEDGWISLLPKKIPGCPTKLSEEQLHEIKYDLFLFDRKPHGKKLAVYIYKKYGVKLTERYCQSLYKKLASERTTLYGQTSLMYMFSDTYDDVKVWMANYETIFADMTKSD